MERKKRVNIDKNVELIIASNTNLRIILDNPRLTTKIDLVRKGDEEYITVGDLRVIVNSNRKLIESFNLIVREILTDEYTLEELFTFVGLEKAYNAYYSLRPNSKDKTVNIEDIEQFIIKSNSERFASVLESADKTLRNKIIHESIVLFRSGVLSDYNKMQAIEKEVKNEELFLDIREAMAYEEQK